MGDVDALPIRSDARVAGATIKAGERVDYALGDGRYAYLVAAIGAVEVNGVPLEARDGAAIRDVEILSIKALEDAEVILVDAA
jgi:redox-sensitive bicupin YhaK (pirin superfamily)